MQRIELNKNWKVTERIEAADFAIPADADDVDLPIDLLTNKERNYSLPYGEYNSYYACLTAVFYKTLPPLKNYAHVYLDLWGVNSSCDVVVNNCYLATIENTAHNYTELTHNLVCGAQNCLKLVVCSPAETGKYTGAGFSGGAALLVAESQVAFKADGVCVRTDKVDEFAHLTVSAEVYNGSDAVKPMLLEAILYNAQGKKVARKVHKIKLAPNEGKTCEIPVRLSRHYDYSAFEPYLYSCTACLYEGEAKLDAVTVPFGIVSVEVSAKGLQLNNRPVKLMGAVMAHDNGLIGNCSVPEAERYKLSKIKQIGYNAVRYSGIPSDAALNTLDKLGLYAVIDLYDVWGQGVFPYDGHRAFNRNLVASTASMVKTLRKHPSVILYLLGNKPAECVGSNGGTDTARMLLGEVRKLDASRPVIFNAGDPTLWQKAKGYGGSTAAGEADVVGFSELMPHCGLEGTAGIPIIGLASKPSRAFDAWAEALAHAHAVGDFQFSGADFLGQAVGASKTADKQRNLFLPPHAAYCGDLDLTYAPKPQSYYREILAGNKSASVITVAKEEGALLPERDGRAAQVNVMTGGEVVALYQNGSLVGRKLAGKANRYVATFPAELVPGRLKAVSFYRGAECARCVLDSALLPRAIRLECAQKFVCAGELCYVEVSVRDAEGRAVSDADCTVEVAVTGEGARVAFGNGDPSSRFLPFLNKCALFNGRALLIVRGLKEGKIAVKAVGNGLLSAKTAVRVRVTKNDSV